MLFDLRRMSACWIVFKTHGRVSEMDVYNRKDKRYG